MNPTWMLSRLGSLKKAPLSAEMLEKRCFTELNIVNYQHSKNKYCTILYYTIHYSTLLYPALPKQLLNNKRNSLEIWKNITLNNKIWNRNNCLRLKCTELFLETEKIRKSDVVNTGETTIKKEHKSKFITLSQHIEVHSITTPCYKKACITDKACKLCLIN